MSMSRRTKESGVSRSSATSAVSTAESSRRLSHSQVVAAGSERRQKSATKDGAKGAADASKGAAKGAKKAAGGAKDAGKAAAKGDVKGAAKGAKKAADGAKDAGKAAAKG